MLEVCCESEDEFHPLYVRRVYYLEGIRYELMVYDQYVNHETKEYAQIFISYDPIKALLLMQSPNLVSYD